MSKRKSSPSPITTLSNRPRVLSVVSESHQLSPRRADLSFDTAFYDELILVIFAHLSWADLCTAQAVNRNWARLATDNQLWKSLYLREYGRGRLRGARGFIGRMDGREVKALPGRARVDGVKDWKWMFRISSNWRTGRCNVERLTEPVDQYRELAGWQLEEQTHILLSGPLIVTSSRPFLLPIISLHHPARPPFALECHSSGVSAVPIKITTLALDQSPPCTTNQARLASFLSDGEFAVFSLNHTNPSASTRKFTYVPAIRTARTAPIIQAVYHHPLLITLSQEFHLSLYDLSQDTIAHTQTLSSFTSFPPTSLVLSAPSSTAYKLVLAYAIPVYPAHWSVGVTELVVSTPGMSVRSIRTTRTIEAPPGGWVDEQHYQAMREQWGRRVARVADTQTDGKWVVLAPGDVPSPCSSGSSTRRASISASPTSLQLYRLTLPASAGPTPLSTSSVFQNVNAPQPKLTFVRTLPGHIGPVSALALADGRCVSLGSNGSIWVWDLEGGRGAEVSTGDQSEGVRGCDEKGTIVFDERRIVSAVPHADGVQVRRFDI